MNGSNSFWMRYKWYFIGAAGVLVVAYIAIYFSFKGTGFIYAGSDLEKRDWLSFVGAYLSFSGTVAVSLIATLQAKYFSEKEKERIAKVRINELQPIFSISIEDIDGSIEGVADVFNLHDMSTYPQHKNVTILIENVGQYPIRNVIVFGRYMFQMLKQNEKKNFQVAYSDSPDIKQWKDHLIELMESDYERTNKGIPQYFNINYDDVDGNKMVQRFELKEFGGIEYYSLEGIYNK